MISIWLRDFPAFKRKQEILIFFGSTRALPTFATHKGTSKRAFVRVRSPSALNPGSVKLLVSHIASSDLPPATTSWEYVRPAPLLLDQSASSRPLGGGTPFEIEFANWPVIVDKSTLSILFGRSPGLITRILWSDGDLGSTRVEVQAPTMEAP